MKKIFSFLLFLFTLIEGGRAQEIIHETTRDSQSGINSRLDIKALYDNPKAVFVAIPLEETKDKLTSPVGVWNNGVHCYVFNTDKTPMPEGVKFRIIYSPVTDSTHFLFQADIYHLKGKVAYINTPSLNGKADAVIQASMSENPSGVMNPREIAFKFDDRAKQWYVYNVDGSPIVKDLGMYIIVSNPGKDNNMLRTKTKLPGESGRPVLSEMRAPVATKDAVYQKDVDFANWNFEDGLTGWSKEGTAFDTQPAFGDNVTTSRVLHQMELNNGGVGGDYWKDQGYDIGRNGNYWIGTYENSADVNRFFQTQGDGAMGVLTSSEFIVTTNYCYFLIGGGADAQNLFVELQVKNPDGSWLSAVKKSSFRNSELLYRERMDIASFKNRVARIRIVDNTSGNWGHINADNFRFTSNTIDAITLRDDATGRDYEVDVTTPVWGIADTHAHPAHDEGFGRYLIAGKATTPIDQTYSTALCEHDHGALGTGIVRKPFIMGADPHDASGWPDLIDFPRFNSKTHQQQHVEFIKRAWQGGLRLLCALAVNNMYVPSLLMGPGNDGTPFDDETVIQRQIEVIKQMAAQNADWMEIALSPKDARRIILQGKLAVVLGIEADNLGNFKAASYNWIDKNAGALWNNPLITLTDANADQLLEAKLTDYYFKGVRQITSMHYISGLFGGAALFRAELAVQQSAFNNDVKVKAGVDKNIAYSLYADFTQVTTFSNPPLVTKDAYTALIKSFGGGPTNLSTINNLGLTNIGNKLILKMMEKGFIIDGEHMGYDTKDNVFSVVAARNYPIISSHTDPAGLCLNWVGAPVEFKDNFWGKDNQLDNQRNFGTTNIRNLSSEFQLADEHYTKIRNSGGTVGVFMLPYFKKPYTGPLGSVDNDCAGSTKTFAQMYLYSVDKMGFKGIGLATDRGMTDFIGPRFGPNSAYALKDEKLMSMRIVERRRQRLAQRNGVRYDVPMQSYHVQWYENLEMKAGLFSILDENIVEYQEEDMWKAFAAAEAGIGVDNVALSREVLRAGRIKNFYEGLTVARMDDPLIKSVAWFEKAAMYCVKNDMDVTSLPGYDMWLPIDKTFTMTLHNNIVPVWQSWQSKYGNNQPLRRLKTGNRYWDFNTDGMAHYGLMPDFLQDLRNIGLGPDKLTTLFRSAEDYIQMWEKTQKASGTNGVPPSPVFKIR